MAIQVSLSSAQKKKFNHLLRFNFWAIDWEFLQLTIPTKAGTNESFKFINDNTLESSDVVVGMNVLRQNDAGSLYSKNGLKVVNQKVHDSSFLNWSDVNGSISIQHMPLTLLEARDAENPMLRVYPDFAKLSSSEIECKNPAELVNDEEFAINVYYISFAKLVCVLDEYDCSPC